MDPKPKPSYGVPTTGATPQPAPTPTSAGAGVLNQVVSGIDTGSGSGAPSWQTQPFDAAGLTGLLPGFGNETTAKGADLVKAFLTAGQSTDPTVRNTVAAIEYALYAAGPGVYYNKGDKPNLGMVSNVDAAALGKALSDLSQIGGGTVGGTSSGDIKPMTIAQFLTSQASLGSANGPTAAAAATSHAAKIVHVPNPANVAAEYRRVAQSLEGGRPTADETARFVHQYMSQFPSQASVNQQKQQAYQQQAAGATPTSPFVPRGADYTGGSNYTPPLPHGITATDPNSGMSPEQPVTGPADLSQSIDGLTQNSPDAMATLQDVLGMGGGGAGGGGTQIVPDAQNLDVAAENFARNANPKAIAGNDMGNALGDFLNLISTKLV